MVKLKQRILVTILDVIVVKQYVHATYAKYSDIPNHETNDNK